MIPYSFQLKHDQNGRIIEKDETVSGKSITWTYAYDSAGRLTEAHLDGRLICQCWYDKEGRRLRDYLPATAGGQHRDYRYTVDNRLQSAGNNTYTHDKSGFRSIWSSGGRYTLYEYAPDYRLLKMEVEGENEVYQYTHDQDGQRETKYRNGQIVEAYKWLDFVRLAGFHAGESAYEFAYEENARTPQAMRRDDGAIATLHYDQVGSLRAIADASGNVIKEVLYDPFGGIIEDTNPALRIPIGFAGGLHDHDLGFVRFGWRDYDVNTGRWTAPDPIGDAGGDNDWYGYCLDDPVNGVDATGLNPFLAWSQYIPAINSVGKWVAEDIMDGSPGTLDLPGLALDGLNAYTGYIKNNAGKIKKDNEAYYDDLYGRNNGKTYDKPNQKPFPRSKSAPKVTKGLWGR